MSDCPEAAEPAQAANALPEIPAIAQVANDLPEIPAIAQVATGDDGVAEATGAGDNQQARRDALTDLAIETEKHLASLRLEKLSQAATQPEPETFAQQDYSAQDYSAQDYSPQDYGRDYASADKPEPRSPLLPPIEAAFREEAVLQAPATSSSPQDAKEMDNDVKKLGKSCGWGCAILFVIWMIAMALMLFINRAG